MQSSAVRLDLSHHDGDAAGPLCGALSGGDWVGVRFPSLTVTPYTMGLVSTSALQPVVTDWGVIGSGLCGSLYHRTVHRYAGRRVHSVLLRSMRRLPMETSARNTTAWTFTCPGSTRT